ncbi:NUDIX hydrolase [Chrysiogenes arsenatis]|uniref:NUDIX hydrolase n=1 Tax=Chrysiogenes arsenatis TaxID=309797 RepID=UPI0003FBC18E|nr:NUDIX hydrolase [Chrysiogenes arsenatis]
MTTKPVYPVIGVAAVIVNHAGEVCIAERGQEPAKGTWTFPGGKLEVGETLEAGLQREIREECNIEIEVLTPQIPLCAIEKMGLDSPNFPHHYVILDYLCRYVNGELRASSDVFACRWVSFDDLKHYTANPTTLWVADLARSTYVQYSSLPKSK